MRLTFSVEDNRVTEGFVKVSALERSINTDFGKRNNRLCSQKLSNLFFSVSLFLDCIKPNANKEPIFFD